jgi:hypothetical protein
VPLMCSKRRLEDVGRVHPDLVVARTQVQLGEEAGLVQLIEELVHHRNRELVLGGDGVEGTVIDAEPLGVVRLVDQEH